MADVEATLFAGPSAFGLPPSLFAGIRRRPPARRGDIERLVKRQPPGVLLLCDGVFQAVPAVSHAELGAALDAGWQVWGVSSLGAIRAWEMRGEGMRGHGHVYAQFARYEDFTDDEMCLLHYPRAPWFPITEALVNLRWAFEQRGEALGISLRQQAIVIDALGALWFGERSEARIRALLTGDAGVPQQATEALLGWLPDNRIKTLDLGRLLAERPWKFSPAA
ncbi:TfuA-like protein [Pelomonas sp. KK5]|uniref:TfuA-like protein n=1 Tax=Pelomonas sp. KK5 TaxID=1855730 RepID=UPI00097BF83B|nr:TfuA-like protein [Pelomonas sp. KK5]